LISATVSRAAAAAKSATATRAPSRAKASAAALDYSGDNPDHGILGSDPERCDNTALPAHRRGNPVSSAMSRRA
jgi:hypothetical protein